MMRVAVFRAAADGLRTAAWLEALGHRAVLAPVIHIVRTGAPIAATGSDAVIFTSAHAPEVLHDDPALHALTRLPCWCVGARTAAAARARGFAEVETGPGDAGRLADVLRARLPARSRLLLLVGRDRKPVLPDRLIEAGFKVDAVEIYDAAAVSEWNATTVEDLGTCIAALHYSRRSAELAMRLAALHGLDHHMARIEHHCLSRDVADGLDGLAPSRLRWAAAPDEASLLAGLTDRGEGRL